MRYLIILNGDHVCHVTADWNACVSVCAWNRNYRPISSLDRITLSYIATSTASSAKPACLGKKLYIQRLYYIVLGGGKLYR